MSLFVVVYDREHQQLLHLRKFSDAQRESAESFRMDEQRRSLREHLDREVVLFHASSEETLRRNHASYFSKQQLRDNLDEAV
jgi:hypothetical protein